MFHVKQFDKAIGICQRLAMAVDPRYPREWPEISLRVRARAGNRCEECGVENGAYGGRANGKFYPSILKEDELRALDWPNPIKYGWCEGYPVEKLRITRVILAAAHLNQTPSDCRDENLKALCRQCHSRYDNEARRHRRREFRK